jgi:hypothetical protein
MLLTLFCIIIFRVHRQNMTISKSAILAGVVLLCAFGLTQAQVPEGSAADGTSFSLCSSCCDMFAVC